MTRHRSPASRVLRHQTRACARPVSGTVEKCPIEIEVRSYAARDYDQCGHYLWPCVRSTSPLASPYPVPSGLARPTEGGSSHAGKAIPEGPLWVRRNSQTQKSLRPRRRQLSDLVNAWDDGCKLHHRVRGRLVSDRVGSLRSSGLGLIDQLKIIAATGPQPQNKETIAATCLMLPISFPIGSFGKHGKANIH